MNDIEAFEKWKNKTEFTFEFQIEGEKIEVPPLFKEWFIGGMGVSWQAACEYKDKEIELIVNENTHYFESLKKCEDDLEKYQAENKKLRKALEFYADFKNWRTVTVSKSNQRFCILTGADLEYFKEPNQDSYCGKRAREALKEVGEE